MTTRILFPVDFSQGYQQALKLAVSLARDHRGELLLLHIEEPPMAYGGGEFYYGPAEPNREHLQRMLDEIVVDDPNIPVRRYVGMGSPGSEIVKFAADHRVSNIVMPTHGRTGLRRLLMGSVAEEVVRKAHCPVITIKCTTAAAEAATQKEECSNV
ncbi:Putative universal stress protein [Anatilimnocola aggregata]|uniref:Universal stress protein n=1 Tax=Anatilimnocola aggregata TaxID=2528021 RepID=A0A517YKD2_9BACT|nr:universal stress protein [Anatilimnocola aggregata]QDU30670.1 Putative universal stress protein [Anatilimnocola aggregata]